jgi:predicted acylesterase/phospholipase RssA
MAPFHLVLGAGGVKGYMHIGALKAVEELGLPIAGITGVSVGAAVAAYATNGYGSQEILRQFLDGHSRMYSPETWMRSVAVPELRKLFVSPSWLSLEGPWAWAVKEHGLYPNERLQIVAHDVVNAKPVVFQGTGYDLGKALAASGSVPEVFSPVAYGDGLLVDGAFYHYNPIEFSPPPVIVVRLNRARCWSRELLSPVDAYYHWRELYMPLLPTVNQVDESRCLLIDMEADDVAGLSFGISERRRLQLVQEGYEIAIKMLRRAIRT